MSDVPTPAYTPGLTSKDSEVNNARKQLNGATMFGRTSDAELLSAVVCHIPNAVDVTETRQPNITSEKDRKLAFLQRHSS